ncbi:MAG: hypothetical protein M3O70_24960 [Actinomycetota bacterium]|nr:hypothetical protein [Actinomycetota bacterium]
MTKKKASLVSSLVRGVLASVAGTAVMTAFQKLVEMPITGRDESDAPAQFVEKILPIGSHEPLTHRQVNYIAHFGIGTLWGTAFALAGRLGLHGQKAVHIVFPTVLTSDILLNIALGLYKPTTWSKQDWGVDIVDKYVQAQATSAVYDRLDRF